MHIQQGRVDPMLKLLFLRGNLKRFIITYYTSILNDYLLLVYLLLLLMILRHSFYISSTLFVVKKEGRWA